MFPQKGLHSVGKDWERERSERSERLYFGAFLFSLVQNLAPEPPNVFVFANTNRDFAALTNAPCLFPGGEGSAQTLLLTVAIIITGL